MIKLFLILILILSTFPGLAPAFGLKVSPAAFIVHNVRPGQIYDVYQETGTRLTIYNDGPTSRKYNLSVEQKSGKKLTGYQSIPDPRWCWFENAEVEVAGESIGYGHIKIQIPDEEKYYNQSWLALFVVKGSSGGRMSLAIQVQVQIETKSKDSVGENPAGIIAVKPNMLHFPSTRGRKLKVIQIYNNDDIDHTYWVTSLLQREDLRIAAYLTQNYRPMLTPEWLSYNKDKFVIKANESKDFLICPSIPDRIKYRRRQWEDVLIVETDDGLSGIIRVRFY